MQLPLRDRLWTAGTFVDFETGLNSAIRKLREAIDDSAANPRFIERVPRRGYRFIAPVSSAPASRAESTSPKSPVFGRSVRTTWIARTFVVVVAAVLVAQTVGSRGGNGRESAPTRAREARAANPQAQELYLKGLLAFGAGQSPQGSHDAVGYFERALAADRDFADAYSMLAQMHFQYLVSGSAEPRGRRGIESSAARTSSAAKQSTFTGSDSRG